MLPRSCLVLPLFLTMASALDMVVRKSSMICDNRPVKMSLNTVCNEDNLCSFGRAENIGGSFVYDGLETYHSATYDDSLYLDATMNLGIAGLTTIQQKMVDNAQVQVCSSFTANDYNMYGDCPADGRYMFNSTYEFPAPGSAFMDWASSGYEGDIELEIYHNMDLVGRCVVDARTLVSGSYEKGAFGSTPSGKIGAIIALSLLGLLVLYILYRGVMAYRARQQKQTPKALPTETPEQGPATEYSRMETGDAPEVQETAPTQTRYTNDGPVI